MIYFKKERFTLLNSCKANLTGFSLMEAMIAVFILMVGILAVLALFPFGTKLASHSKMATIAIQLAQEKMEEIIPKPYSNIMSEPEQTLTIPFNAYSRKTDIACFDPNGTLLPDCPETGIKEIKVTVSWASSFGATSPKIELYTLISQR